MNTLEDLQVKSNIKHVLDRFQDFGIKIHQYPNAIGLWTNEQECLLWSVFNCDSNLDWMEIGSFHGGSAVLMCLARQMRGNKPHIVSIDRYFDPMFDRNIELGGFNKLSKKVQCDSIDFLKHYNKPISFGFIDGWHSFKGSYLDFQQVDKILVSGGMVAFHDVDYFENDQQIEDCYKSAKENFDYYMSEPLPNDNLDEQSFNLEDVVAYIINEHSYELVKIPLFNGIRRPPNVWKPGTPDTNSYVALRKK